MSDVYIYDHVRTPRGRGKPDGGLHEATPVHLATTVLEAIRDRSGLDTALVDDIVMGIVSPVGEQGQVLPRLAAINAGYAETTAGVQLNRFCGSGLEAVNTAAGKIAAGGADFVIAGGVESMSRVPILSDGGAWTTDPAIAYASHFIPQGVSADLIASKYGYSRADLDGFAARSHARAHAAWEAGYFDGSIALVRDVLGEVLLERDENIRPQTSVETLSALTPSFAKMGGAMGYDAMGLMRYPEVDAIGHFHHPGNSSAIVDGACAMLLGSAEAGKAAGLKPRARIRGFAEIGSEPTIMLTAPAAASEKALRRAGMSKSDIDLFEINEAFAAVALRFTEALDLDSACVNVNGGAIAMGHPLGATGAMILGTALDELERTGQKTALATLCIGAGMGIATIIERV